MQYHIYFSSLSSENFANNLETDQAPKKMLGLIWIQTGNTLMEMKEYFEKDVISKKIIRRWQEHAYFSSTQWFK